MQVQIQIQSPNQSNQLVAKSTEMTKAPGMHTCTSGISLTPNLLISGLFPYIAGNPTPLIKWKVVPQGT